MYAKIKFVFRRGLLRVVPVATRDDDNNNNYRISIRANAQARASTKMENDDEFLATRWSEVYFFSFIYLFFFFNGPRQVERITRNLQVLVRVHGK